MGREIRRVPPNWEHPMQECPHAYGFKTCCDEATRNGTGRCYKPLYDRVYEEEAKEWLEGCAAWEDGTHKDLQDDPDLRIRIRFYWDWHGMPPNEDYYRPRWTEEPTAYCVYQTVSEGTPVTPVFATKAELIEYLVTHGDFWDQYEHGKGGWKREAAERFVEQGSAPTMMTISTPGEPLQILEPRDGI